MILGLQKFLIEMKHEDYCATKMESGEWADA